MNAEEPIPLITSTAPLYAGKRDSNYSFLNNFRTPFKPTLVKETISSQSSKLNQTLTKVPLPQNQPLRDPCLTPFERSDLQYESRNLIRPESRNLRFAIFFLLMSIIFLALFLSEFHPEIFLLLSILFFSLAVYPFAKYIKNKNKNAPKSEEKKSSKLIHRQAPGKKNSKPSEKIAMFESTKQNRKLNQNIEVSGDLYPPFNNADRPAVSIVKASSVVASSEAQIDSRANKTLKDLKLKLSDFHQYYTNLKNFIQKNIISKINLTSDKQYVNMMLSVPGYDRNYVIGRIRELAGSPLLAGHLAENGDNQIVLHILSVWLSYLMTCTTEDKRPQPVFSEKYIITDGKEPKLDSDGNIYFVANKEYNYFYVIFRPRKKADGSSEAVSVEKYYTYQGKDCMYSSLAIFFYLIKTEYDSLLEGADLDEPPFYMSRIFETAHLA